MASGTCAPAGLASNAVVASERPNASLFIMTHLNAPARSPYIRAEQTWARPRPCQSHRRISDRRVGESLVGLRLRLRLVLGIEVLDRALAQQGPRQDHHADEAGRPVARPLRKHRVRPALVPSTARPI